MIESFVLRSIPPILVFLSYCIIPLSTSYAQEKNILRRCFNLSEEYIIGPEDVIEVVAWNDASISRTVIVRPDGKISLPLIDDIKAAGLTAEELMLILTARFREFVGNPDLTVIISEINSWKIYLHGEIVSPGLYHIKSNTTILQAIALAGGLSEWAKQDKIKVISTNDVETEIKTVNYGKIVDGKDLDQNIVLKPGDTIIVP